MLLPIYCTEAPGKWLYCVTWINQAAIKIAGPHNELTEPPLPGIAAGWGGSQSPPKVPLLRLQGNIPSHMLDTNDSWNAAPSVDVWLLIPRPQFPPPPMPAADV